MKNDFFPANLNLNNEEKEILRESIKDNPFLELQQEFRSYYLLDKHIQSSPAFKFVKPTEIHVRPLADEEDSFTFQYVSLVDTLSTIIEDPDFVPEKPSEDGMLRGVKDGTVYAENAFFQVLGATNLIETYLIETYFL